MFSLFICFATRPWLFFLSSSICFNISLLSVAPLFFLYSVVFINNTHTQMIAIHADNFHIVHLMLSPFPSWTRNILKTWLASVLFISFGHSRCDLNHACVLCCDGSRLGALATPLICSLCCFTANHIANYPGKREAIIVRK